jgi:hypothetical protein
MLKLMENESWIRGVRALERGNHIFGIFLTALQIIRLHRNLKIVFGIDEDNVTGYQAEFPENVVETSTFDSEPMI